MIVPGGGLSKDGSKWIACRKNFFLSVHVLSRLYRRLILEGLIRLHNTGKLQFFGDHADLIDKTTFDDFLKPLHKTTEFCSVCHKVHLPLALNKFKHIDGNSYQKHFIRGQNHYDAFLLSGLGHGASSFYYPPKAETNCNRCHMPSVASNDFGARPFGDSGTLSIHDHLFPGANTGIARYDPCV